MNQPDVKESPKHKMRSVGEEEPGIGNDKFPRVR